MTLIVVGMLTFSIFQTTFTPAKFNRSTDESLPTANSGLTKVTIVTTIPGSTHSPTSSRSASLIIVRDALGFAGFLSAVLFCNVSTVINEQSKLTLEPSYYSRSGNFRVNFRMINFRVKKFSQERPLTALALIVRTNFRKINFRSHHRLRKYFYNENFQIYGTYHLLLLLLHLHYLSQHHIALPQSTLHNNYNVFIILLLFTGIKKWSGLAPYT